MTKEVQPLVNINLQAEKAEFSYLLLGPASK